MKVSSNLFKLLVGLQELGVKRLWVILFSAILLSGCGQKGALYLPQQPEVQQMTETKNVDNKETNESMAIINDETQDY